MVEFWTKLHQPDAVLMLFIAVLCLLGYVLPGVVVQGEQKRGFAWVVFLVVGVLAFVEWVTLLFLS